MVCGVGRYNSVTLTSTRLLTYLNPVLYPSVCPVLVPLTTRADTPLCRCAVYLATAGWQQQVCCASVCTLLGRAAVVSAVSQTTHVASLL